MKRLTSLLAILPLFLSSLHTTVHATSDSSLVILQVQAAGVGSTSATQEYILLYNNSVIDQKITNWCVEYSSAADGAGFKSCIAPPDSQTDLFVPSSGYVSFATAAFVVENPSFTPDFIFTAGMNHVSGHLRIRNDSGVEIDRVGWGAAQFPEGTAASQPNSGEVMSRLIYEGIAIDTDDNAADFISTTVLTTVTRSLYEELIVIDRCENIEGVQSIPPDEMLADENNNCYVDFCPNLDGLQLVAPDGYQKLVSSSDVCTPIPLEDAMLEITEVYANAPGTDTGKEYIEVHNPNDFPVNMKGYSLQVGPTFATRYVFEDLEIALGSYVHFSDTTTGIVLPNSNGVQLRLLTAAGRITSETPVYTNANEDESWSLLADNWEYTNQLTPSAVNKASVIEEENTEEESADTIQCAEGKFLNPATNRCKNIESASASLVPCDEDEFRNPLTNRCNKVSSTSSTLTPCKPGQVRNPETNRCRSVETASSDLVPCEEGEERNPETNRCRKIATLSSTNGSALGSVTDVPVDVVEGQINWGIIAISVFGTLGYMIYEWRNELRQKYRYIRLTHRRSP